MAGIMWIPFRQPDFRLTDRSQMNIDKPSEPWYHFLYVSFKHVRKHVCVSLKWLRTKNRLHNGSLTDNIVFSAYRFGVEPPNLPQVGVCDRSTHIIKSLLTHFFYFKKVLKVAKLDIVWYDIIAKKKNNIIFMKSRTPSFLYSSKSKSWTSTLFAFLKCKQTNSFYQVTQHLPPRSRSACRPLCPACSAWKSDAGRRRGGRRRKRRSAPANGWRFGTCCWVWC